MHVAELVVLTTAVVEAVRDLMSHGTAYGSIINGARVVAVEDGRLENAGREDYKLSL